MGMTVAFEAPRKLTPADSLEGFHCGVALIDDWVRMRAHDAERHGTAVVYVSHCEGIPAGVYSLSAHAIVRSEVQGGWLRRNAPESIPAALLGMLGVDERFQGCGLGASLLSDAIKRSLTAAAQIGIKALLVDPFDDTAQAFYRKYGFAQIPGLDRMFIPLKLPQ